jgi:hypothetical protein
MRQTRENHLITTMNTSKKREINGRSAFGTVTLLAIVAGCGSAENGAPTTTTDSTSETNATTSQATNSNPPQSITTTNGTATTTAQQTPSQDTGVSPTTSQTSTNQPNDTTSQGSGDTTAAPASDSSDAQTTSAVEPTTSGGDSGNDTATSTGLSSDTSTSSGGQTSEDQGTDVVDVGADDKLSFFVTSYYHLALLSGSEDGFGGDLRYNGATTGLEGADAICQEMARRVGFGSRTWRAYLSTSTVNAIDRIGTGPWYDFVGALVANSPAELISGSSRQPGGCCEEGTYDEVGLFHNGSTDQNNDGIDDDDHDTMTATNEEGTYSGFSCDDWTSTTATDPALAEMEEPGEGGGGFGGGFGGGPGLNGGIMMGHSWPAGSGQHWATSHGGHNCAAGTNFIQDGPGSPDSVGGGGGYGGFYCFALTE